MGGCDGGVEAGVDVVEFLRAEEGEREVYRGYFATCAKKGNCHTDIIQ